MEKKYTQDHGRKNKTKNKIGKDPKPSNINLKTK